MKKTTSTLLVLLYATILLSVATGLAIAADPIVTESTSTSAVSTKTDSTTTLKSPPNSAISPSISATNSDLCTVGVAGAVQTQILGISAGSTVRDMNCERLKLSKTLYDMGMKVAAVSVMCQDTRVFDAMMMAGTPCPFDGKIGNEAKELWKANPDKNPIVQEEISENTKDEIWSLGGIAALLLIL